LHAQVSIACRFAQTTGEIRDILVIARVAVQQFVSACVFFAILAAISSVLFRASKAFGHVSDIFFL
jgi:hypothetical protein